MYNSGTTPLSAYVPANILHSAAFSDFLSALRDRVHGRGVQRGSEEEERRVRAYVASATVTGRQRLREALTLTSDATDADVNTELKALDTAAARSFLAEHATLYVFEERALYLYRESAGDSIWWIADADDMAQLGELLVLAEGDVYASWCAATSAIEVDPRAIVASFGIDEDTDLAALADEAGAADDMTSYLALYFLDDEIAAVIADS